MTDSLVPVTIRVSYDVLKDMLHLPEDVKVLGIVGVDDLDGSFPLIIETPPKHIKRTNLSAVYRKESGKVEFVGFE